MKVKPEPISKSTHHRHQHPMVRKRDLDQVNEPSSLSDVDSNDEKVDKLQVVAKRKVSKKTEGVMDRKPTLLTDRFRRLVEVAGISKKFVGAHVSMAGGVEHAIYNSIHIGGQAFALFLKSQRRWESPPLDEAHVVKFRNAISQHSYDYSKILPHGSYLVNLGSSKKDLLEKGRTTFFDDLERCERLGIHLYNFHPGSATGNESRNECIHKIAESINIAHHRFKRVICVIENMSGQGTAIGGDFRELAAIIERVEDKCRIGVCLDTCHLFAYGYDIRTAEKFDKVMREFDSIVGLRYLRAMHINDCKAELGSNKDRHENIGKGRIGMEAFRFIMNDPRFNHIPLILETPVGSEEDATVYQREIDLLYSLVEGTTTR
jgi:AP endonuclease 1